MSVEIDMMKQAKRDNDAQALAEWYQKYCDSEKRADPSKTSFKSIKDLIG